MDKQALEQIAQKMVAQGKGILAADESTGTIKKRFDSIGLESHSDSRRDWREMLFRTDEAMQNYISGVILYDETIRQTAQDGTPLPEIMSASGAIVGIKVDTGAKEMAGHKGEKVTEGLDGLRARLQDYYGLGARFAKWRAVIQIGQPSRADGDSLPSRACLVANMHALARYAALCQEQNIVPIVEPEVIMDGTHSQRDCYDVTLATLTLLYEQLNEQGIYLAGTILKPNMIVSGTKHPEQANIEQVAEMTLACFQKSVPKDVAGIVFLSGGQSDIDATAHLDAMNKMAKANKGSAAWPLRFSYGRALQAAPLKAWGGKPDNVQTAQATFAHRARMNGLAAQGKWDKSLEQA